MIHGFILLELLLVIIIIITILKYCFIPMYNILQPKYIYDSNILFAISYFTNKYATLNTLELNTLLKQHNTYIRTMLFNNNIKAVITVQRSTDNKYDIIVTLNIYKFNKLVYSYNTKNYIYSEQEDEYL